MLVTAVEVLKSSANDDWAVKVSLYACFGTPETWLVDVEQGLIEIHRALGPECYQ